MSKWGHVELANLNELLANLYPSEADARRLATKAGLRQARIDFAGSSLSRWFNILDHANALKKVSDIVAAALKENPDDESLREAGNGRPPPAVKGPETKWAGTLDSDQLEKIIGSRTTLVPISYLELGLARSRSVVRVKRPDGSSGTGFITTNNILITNHHVLPSADRARSTIVQFNYQQTVEGLHAPLEEAYLAPDAFFLTSVEDDWSAVKVDGDASTRWGTLPLRASQVSVGDYVNIIQHPGGGPKQIAISADVVVFIGGGRVQYLTDTLPGSSGSPVFDANWNVVALHRSGGWLREPNAPSKTTYYRNEGIAIERIVNGLAGRC